MAQLLVSTAKRMLPSSSYNGKDTTVVDSSEPEKDGAFSDDFDAMFEPNKIPQTERRDSGADFFQRIDSNSSYEDSSRDYITGSTSSNIASSLKLSVNEYLVFGSVSDDISDYFEEGEVRHILVDPVSAYENTDSSASKINGKLVITNYKLLFHGKLHHGLGYHAIQIPLRVISAVKLLSKNQLHIATRHFRMITLFFDDRETECMVVYSFINKNLKIESMENVFAFKYKHQTRQKRLVADEFKLTFEKFNSWRHYDPTVEYNRMNIKGAGWCLIEINRDHSFIPSYPSMICVPAAMSTKDLTEAANFRTQRRIPVLSWKHPHSGVTLTRCSQPRAGLSGVCTEDEKLVRMIRATNSAKSEWLYIVDARPKANAIGNQLMGSGFEKGYENCKIQFMDIENIHEVRACMKQVFELISTTPLDGDSYWLSQLEATELFKHIQLILSASVDIVDILERKNSSVMVHCSDGWDRTPQMMCLAQLMVDPYYRTIEGFIRLIEKEWLSFGHQFAARCHGYGNFTKDPQALVTTDSESYEYQRSRISPIFLLFVDCVYQLKMQFTVSFQFNIRFLLLLIDSCYDCKYGTFLYNTERERVQYKLFERTESLWDHVYQHLEAYSDPMYFPRNQPRVLIPTCSLRRLVFFRELYLRWDYRLRTKQDHEVHVHAVLKENQDLKHRVRSLERQLREKEQLLMYGNNKSEQAQIVAKFVLEDILDSVMEQVVKNRIQNEANSVWENETKRKPNKGGSQIANVDHQRQRGTSFHVPKWMPDGSATQCHRCRTTFGLLKRKHHCRNCGEIFCDECTSTKMPLPHLKIDSPQRVCFPCSQKLRQRRTLNEFEEEEISPDSPTEPPKRMTFSPGMFNSQILPATRTFEINVKDALK